MKLLVALGVLMDALVSASHAQAITPKQLVEVVDIGQPVVSPDGRWVAFRTEQASIERNTYDSVWYVQGLYGNSSPMRIGDGGFPLRDSAGLSVPAEAIWSPDGRWVYYRAQIGGRIDVWRASTDGSGTRPVTLDPADVRDFVLNAGGTALEYSVGTTREDVTAAELAEYDRGIHIDESVPIGQNLYRSGFIEGRLATQRFGKVWFDRASLLSEVPDRWKVINLAAGERRELAGSGIPPKRLEVSDLTGGRGVAWKLALNSRGRIALLERTGEKDGLRENPDVELSMWQDARSGPAVKCAAEPCAGKSITGVRWRPAANEVLFTVTDPAQGNAQSIFRWNVDTGSVRVVTRSDGLVNGGRDPDSNCGVSSGSLVCVAARANQPPRLERIDIDTGRRVVLFDPNATLAVQTSRSMPVRLLRWSDDKGRQFTGQYFPARKAVAELAPLFVNYYSCTGFVRGAYGDEWPLASLAAQGIAALCINHAPGYVLDAVERYNQGLGAVRSVIDLLASEREIDRAKVGIGGLSFGSEVAMWVATESRLASAVSVSTPVGSLNYYQFGSLKGEPFIAGLENMWGLRAPNETPERWRVISPTFKLDKVSAPILFQMAEQEYLYSLDYAIPLIRQHRGDLYVFPNEPHQKFQPKHKLAVYERNLDWFRFWLKNEEDADPAKEEQYLRWRTMKEAMRSADNRPNPGD